MVQVSATRDPSDNAGRAVNRPVDPRPVPPSDDAFAEALRGFGPVGILAMVVVLFANAIVAPLSAILVLLWARRSGTPWHEIGYVRPRSWTTTLVVGVLLGVVLKLVMKAIVMPLLGADPLNQAYQHLVGNRAALPGMLFAMIIGAGFGEETLFRGYLFERLGRLVGRGLRATTVTVLLTSAWFGLLHYPEQGLPGVQQATIVGLVFGTIYASTRRIWMVMVAHAAFDLTALAIIYFGLEARVARLLFG